MASLTDTTHKRVLFGKRQKGDFYATAKQRVDRYFAERGLSRHANWVMVAKTVVLHLVYVSLYLAIITSVATTWGLVLLYALLGVTIGLIGFNLTHDALHGSYSGRRLLDEILGYSFDLNGTSSYVWKITHNLHHHVYTNIPGIDEDIDKAIFLRLSPNDNRYPFHALQHLYAPLLYCFTSLNWVLYSDYTWFFAHRSDEGMRLKDIFLFIAFKILNLTLFLVLPWLLIDTAWYWVPMGFFVMHFAGGFTIALVFQLAHIVEGLAYPQPAVDGKIEESWAEHEMRTTADFATNSKLLTLLLGGLNFQIEHHLFPHICHIHYPKIAPIVKSTAAEFGLPYHESLTFFQALRSHFRHLRALGRG